MVYIYGGDMEDYASGAAGYFDGAMLSVGNRDAPVVIVCIQYRLGLFGFFCHPDLKDHCGTSGGNFGIIDIVESLRWVQRHIGNFSGDKDNVTICGQGTGGSFVQMLLTSPI